MKQLWLLVVISSFFYTAQPHETLSDIQEEELREQEINDALLASCLQILTNLGTIAFAPDKAPSLVDFFVQTARLILNVAHTIFKKPMKCSDQQPLIDAFQLLRKRIQEKQNGRL